MFKMIDNSTGHLDRVSQEFGFGRYKISINGFSYHHYVHLSDEKKKKSISFIMQEFEELLEIASHVMKEGTTIPLVRVSC